MGPKPNPREPWCTPVVNVRQAAYFAYVPPDEEANSPPFWVNFHTVSEIDYIPDTAGGQIRYQGGRIRALTPDQYTALVGQIPGTEAA